MNYASPKQGGTFSQEHWRAWLLAVNGGGPGIADGLALTAGTGAAVDVTAGAAIVGGVVVYFAATQTVALTDNATNYVWLKSDGTFTKNTTGVAESVDDLYLGEVTVASTAVTTLRNARGNTKYDRVFRYKDADELRDTAGAVIDDDLQFTARAGEVWEVIVSGGLVSITGSDFSSDMGVSVPSGASVYGFGRASRHGLDTTGTANYLTAVAFDDGTTTEGAFAHALSTGASNFNAHFLFRAVVEMGATGGAVGFKWGPTNGAPSYDLTLAEGSYLIARRIAM